MTLLSTLATVFAVISGFANFLLRKFTRFTKRKAQKTFL